MKQEQRQKPDGNKKKFFLYMRFSTPEQSLGASARRQLDAAQAICQKYDWELDVSTSFDDLGKSAFKTGKQVGLHRFIEAVEAKRIPSDSVLLVEKLDRLSRQEIDVALGLWLKILGFGITIVTVNPERVFTPESRKNTMQIVEALLGFALAHDESQKKSINTKHNWFIKREKAKQTGKPIAGGKLPAWICTAGNNLVLNEPKAEIIRKIYQMCLDGHGARSIMKFLNTNKIENIAIGYSRISKSEWNLRYVEAILRDRRVIGIHQHFTMLPDGSKAPGETFQNYYPPVIDPDLFEAAQAARRSRARTPSSTESLGSSGLHGPAGPGITNIFQGLLYEEATGRKISLTNSSKYDKKVGCLRRLSAGSLSCKYEHLEVAFLDVVRLRNFSIEEPKNNGPELELLAAENRLQSIGSAIQRLTSELLESPYDSGFALLREFDSQQVSLQQQVDALRTKAKSRSSHENMKRIIDHLAECPKDERVTLRRRLRSEIRIQVARIEIAFHGAQRTRERRISCTIRLRSGGIQRFTIVTDRGKLSRVYNVDEAGTEEPVPVATYRLIRKNREPAIHLKAQFWHYELCS